MFFKEVSVLKQTLVSFLVSNKEHQCLRTKVSVQKRKQVSKNGRAYPKTDHNVRILTVARLKETLISDLNSFSWFLIQGGECQQITTRLKY